MFSGSGDLWFGILTRVFGPRAPKLARPKKSDFAVAEILKLEISTKGAGRARGWVGDGFRVGLGFLESTWGRF